MATLSLDLLGWVYISLSGISAAVGHLLVKKSRLNPGDPGLASLVFSPWFLGAIAFYLLNIILLAKALDRAPVSVAYPAINGINFLVLVLGAALIFGEALGWQQYLGLAAIVLGVCLVGQV